MTTVFLKPASAGPDNINDSGVDTVFGSLTPFFIDGVGPTLNSGDFIQNVASLIITDGDGNGFDIIPAGAFLANIGNVSLVTAGNAGAPGQPFDTAPFSGIKTETVSSSGSGVDNVNAGQSTAIVVNQNSTGGGAGAVVTGGSNVTVTSYGGNGVIIGNSNLGSVPLAGQTPTGLVTVTENGQGDVYVMGGSSVTVTATSSSYGGNIEIGNTDNNTGNSTAGGFANPNGPISVADYGSNGTVTVYGGSKLFESDVFVAAAGDEVIVGDGTALNDPTGDRVTVDDIAPVTWTDHGGQENDVTIHGGYEAVTVYTNTGSVSVLDPSFAFVAITDQATAHLDDGSSSFPGLLSGASVHVTGVNAKVAVSASGTDVEIGLTATFGIGGPEITLDGPTGTVTVTNFAASSFDGILNTVSAETIIFHGAIALTAATIINPFGSNIDVATNAGDVIVIDPRSYEPGPNLSFDPVAVTNLATGFVPGSMSSDAPESVGIFGGRTVAAFAASGSIDIGTGSHTVDDIVFGGDEYGTSIGVANPFGQVVVDEIGVNTGYQYDNHIAVGGGTDVVVVTTGAGGDGEIYDLASSGGSTFAFDTGVNVGPGISVGSPVEDGGSPVIGAVTIYDLYSGRHHEPITVLGGTTVSINTTYTSGHSGGGTITVGATPVLNIAGTAATNLADDPTGTVQIDDSSTFGSKIYFGQETFNVVTNGSAVVYIQGGAGGTIQDAQSTLTGTSMPLGTSHLQTVILDGVTSGVSITSDALANLTIANTSNMDVALFDDTANAALTVTMGFAHDVVLDDEGGQGGFSGSTPFIGLLAVNTVGTGSNNFFLDMPDVTLLAFDAGAGSSLTLDGGILGALKKILVNGGGAANLGDFSGPGNAALTAIDASGNSGGVEVAINPSTTSFTGGSGNDTLVLTQNAFGAGVSLNGGGGSNIVYADYVASGGDVALGTIALSQFENFQSFGVEGAANGTYSVQGFANLVVGVNDGGTAVGPAGAIDFTNVAQGTTLQLIDTLGAPITYALATPFSGTGGALIIQDGLDGVAAGNTDFLNLSGDNITSLTVNSQGKAGNELFIDNAPLTSVTITGDASLDLIDGSGSSDVKAIDASASSGAFVDVRNLFIDHGGVTVTGGSGEILAEGYFGATTPTSAKDTFNIGTGGAQITLGAGGAGYNAGTGTNTGSETVNLTAGAAIGTTITAIANVDASALTGPTTDGTYGIVNNWSFGTIASHQTADLLLLPAPVIIANATGVSEAHGTYNVSDGVITSTGTVSFLNELSDAQAIVDAAPVGTVAEVTIFASQAAPQTATYIIENEGGGAADIFVQLNGVSAVTGFGAVPDPDPSNPGDIGAGTSVSINNPTAVDSLFTNLTDNTNTGATNANHTFDEKGLNNVIANAITGTGFSTTFNNLGNFGVVKSVSNDGGNLVVTQVGIDPVLTLTATSDVILDSFTYGNSAIANDDPTLVLNSDLGFIDITNVVDASNTGTTILIQGNLFVTVDGVTDTALTRIDASSLNALLNLTANQNGLTIVGATADGDQITANGTGDNITVGSASHLTNTGVDVLIQAGGNGDHISVFGGFDADIGAAGTGDVITVAGSASTNHITGNGNSFSSGSPPLATQLGAGDTINVGVTGHTADVHAWLGANSTVNLSTGSSVDLHLLGDIAGASETNMTVINGVDANGDGVRLHFNDFNPGNNSTGISESWAGNGASYQSQVNVATAATLQQALSLAASQALVIDQQFGGGNTTVSGNSLQLDSKTGLFDWFQFGGNTYLVEAVNSTNTNATHAALGTNDIVVKLAGIVDANHIDVAHVVFSDIRLKRDIAEVAYLHSGIRLYRYRYKWSDQVYVGVMAQEVAEIVPEAVVQAADGYFRVNYERLGLKLMTWDEWLQSNAERTREIAA